MSLFGLNPFTGVILMLLGSAFYEAERNVLPVGPTPFLVAAALMVLILIVEAVDGWS